LDDSASDRSDGSATPDHRTPVDIERVVRAEVENRMTKEIGLLKESVTLAIKILGAAFAVLLAIFTVFGLTTWRDIKQETAQLVKKEAEELILKADSDTSVKATLNDLLNRTVISSYLAAKLKDSSHAIELPQNDWARIRAWIKNEDLPLQEFSDALALLNLQNDERKKSDANRLIAEMLNPPDKSPYRWMAKQPEKTEAILGNFKHPALGAAAVELVASPALTDSIRGAAAAYVREVRFTDGVDRLLSIYRTLPWGEARKNALIACVTLRPADAAIVAELRRLIEEPSSKERIDTVVAIINILPDIRSQFSPSVNLDELNHISKDMLRYATAHGLYFELVYPDLQLMAMRARMDDEKLFSRSLGQVSPSIQMMVMRSKTSAEGAGSMTVAALKRFDAYWTLLGDLANAGDMEGFRRLFLRSGPNKPENQPRIRVSVFANPDASMIVAQDQGPPVTLAFKSIRNFFVSSTNDWSNPEIDTAWVDDTGEHTGKVTAFRGKGYKFYFEVAGVKQ
jgi:hypothetical protein